MKQKDVEDATTKDSGDTDKVSIRCDSVAVVTVTKSLKSL